MTAERDEGGEGREGRVMEKTGGMKCESDGGEGRDEE